VRRPPTRLVFSVIDQGVSSLSNVLLSVAVARAARPDLYAHYLLAITLVVAVLTVTRQGAGAYLVAVSGGTSADPGASARFALLAQYAMAPLAAAGPAVLLFGTGDPQSRAVLLALAVSGPIVVAQDGLRYLAVSRGRAGVALTSDLAWLGLLLLAWAFVAPGTEAPFLLVCAWGAGSLVGFAVLASVVGGRAQIRGWRTWWTGARGPLLRLFGDGVISAATPVGIVAIIGAGLPLLATGAYLASTVVFGPINVLITLFAFVLSAELERVHERARALKLFIRVGAATGAAIAGYTVLAVMLPDAAGRALLGATWSSAWSILPFRGLETAALGILNVLYAYWRWSRLYATQLWSRVAMAVAALLSVGIGCLTFGTGRAVAALSALAVSAVLAGSVGFAAAAAPRGVPERRSITIT
jgi:hypothetical protein